MKQYQAVLFDLDGTLVDTQRGIIFCFEQTFAQFGVALGEKQLKRYLGPPLRKSFGEHLPQDMVEQAVEKYRALYDRCGIKQAQVFDGVLPMLKALKERGIVTAVATSKMHEAAQKVLEYFHLSEYFDVIQGASRDSSLDTKTAVMQRVLEHPALKGCRAVMVGDREHDLTGAANCGIDAVGCMYGYAQPGELEAGETVYLAGTPQDLTKWLMQSCLSKGASYE